MAKSEAFPMYLPSDVGPPDFTNSASHFKVALDRPFYLDPSMEWQVALREVICPKEVTAENELMELTLCAYNATSGRMECGDKVSEELTPVDMVDTTRLFAKIKKVLDKSHEKLDFCSVTLGDSGTQGDKVIKVIYDTPTGRKFYEPFWPYLKINKTMQRILGFGSTVFRLGPENPLGNLSWDEPMIRFMLPPHCRPSISDRGIEYRYFYNKPATRSLKSDMSVNVLDIRLPKATYKGAFLNLFREVHSLYLEAKSKKFEKYPLRMVLARRAIPGKGLRWYMRFEYFGPKIQAANQPLFAFQLLPAYYRLTGLDVPAAPVTRGGTIPSDWNMPSAPFTYVANFPPDAARGRNWQLLEGTKRPINPIMKRMYWSANRILIPGHKVVWEYFFPYTTSGIRFTGTKNGSVDFRYDAYPILSKTKLKAQSEKQLSGTMSSFKVKLMDSSGDSLIDDEGTNFLGTNEKALLRTVNLSRDLHTAYDNKKTPDLASIQFQSIVNRPLKRKLVPQRELQIQLINKATDQPIAFHNPDVKSHLTLSIEPLAKKRKTDKHSDEFTMAISANKDVKLYKNIFLTPGMSMGLLQANVPYGFLNIRENECFFEIRTSGNVTQRKEVIRYTVPGGFYNAKSLCIVLTNYARRYMFGFIPKSDGKCEIKVTADYARMKTRKAEHIRINEPLSAILGWTETLDWIRIFGDIQPKRTSDNIIDPMRGFHMLFTYCDLCLTKEPLGNVTAAVLNVAVPDYGSDGDGRTFKLEPKTVLYRSIKPGLPPLDHIRVDICDSLGRQLAYPPGQKEEPSVELHFKKGL